MNQPDDQYWTGRELKNPHGAADKARRVRVMFDGIAGVYDLLNHVLSFGLDVHWRRRGVRLAQVGPGQRVLDLCCGTGDMALEFVKAEPGLTEVVGLDFSEEMLRVARRKYRSLVLKRGGCGSRCRGGAHGNRCNDMQIKWLCGDAQQIGFGEGSFDRVSCVFGVRNLQDAAGGLREMHRVLKPGGRAVILEFAMPKNAVVGWLFQGYFRMLLPLIGGMMAGVDSRAYQYLPASVMSSAPTEQLAKFARDAGFETIYIERLTFGIVVAVVAEKK